MGNSISPWRRRRSSNNPTLLSWIRRNSSTPQRPRTTQVELATTRLSSTPTDTIVEESYTEEVTNLLECSVCMDLCSGRIQQCKNGHNICASHSSHLLVCPVCRISYKLGSSRNLLAEKLVAQQREKMRMIEEKKLTEINSAENNELGSIKFVLCPNAVDGCRFKCDANLLRDHELVCEFRPIKCCFATDGCNHALIKFGQYIEHLKLAHKIKSVKNSSICCSFDARPGGKLVRDGSASLFVLETYGQQFVAKAKQIGERINICVALHGDVKRGRGYICEIEIDTIRGHKRFVRDMNQEFIGRLSAPVDNTTHNLDNLVMFGRSGLNLAAADVRRNLRRANVSGRMLEFWWAKVSIQRDN